MLRFGDDDNFLFHNRTRVHGLGSKWGLSIAIRWGTAYFPIGVRNNKKAMHGGPVWKVFKFPVIAPWISAMAGKYGFYFGFKMIHWHPDYTNWVKKEDWPKWNDGDKLEATCVHPSGRMTDSYGA